MQPPRTAARVLIVDDDQDNAKTLAMLLSAHGYDAHFCVDSKNAMATGETLRPQVLLLDLRMPEMDGFAIVQELNAHPDLRPKLLVAVSGFGRDTDRARTKAAGFDHHLLKPVALQDLLTVLQEAKE